MLTPSIRKLFAYELWANGEVLASLRAAADVPGPALRRAAHVIGTSRLWLSRLRGVDSPLAVWPELSLDDCERELALVHAAWDDYLEALDPEAIATPVSYVNSQGESFSSAVPDVLMHMILHSAYHRGQVNSDLRAAGIEPRLTDYVHATRNGLVR